MNEENWAKLGHGRESDKFDTLSNFPANLSDTKTDSEFTESSMFNESDVLLSRFPFPLCARFCLFLFCLSEDRFWTYQDFESFAKLRDLAAWQAGAGCYFWAALSSNDSKTR